MKHYTWSSRLLVLVLILVLIVPLAGLSAAQGTEEFASGSYRTLAGPIAGVSIAGPETGLVGVAYTFTATVGPLTATLPVTYTWQATDHAPVTYTAGLSDTASFTWSVNGPQVVTVTARNAAGSARSTHSIVISPLTPWTMIIYLNGDNNLDFWTDDLFNKLESAAGNPNVHIVVLWDRHPGGMWDDGACLYAVQPDTNPGRLFPYTENLNRWCRGELNMGDRQTLADLVDWARANYPAQHYFLSVFDHGGGWAPELPPLQPPPVYAWLEGGLGLSWDDTDMDYLSNYDLGWALSSVGPLDVVFYDACLMAMLENAYEIHDQADYLIASENLALGTFPYDHYIDAITATTLPSDLATQVAQIYMDSLPPGFSGSLSVLQLDKTDAVVSAVSGLAQALQALLPSPTAREQIAAAYVGAQKLDYDNDLALEPERDGYVDLLSFAEQVMLNVTDTQAIVAAVRVISALDDGAILYEAHRDGYPYSGTLGELHGTSIYMPMGEELYIGAECLSRTLDVCAQQLDPECIQLRHFYTTTTPPQERQLRFAQDSLWDEFVHELIDAYYGCPDRRLAGAWPTGVLPPVRPIQILSEPEQRPSPIAPEWYVYVPIVAKR